jgi:hypothetical protein
MIIHHVDPGWIDSRQAGKIQPSAVTNLAHIFEAEPESDPWPTKEELRETHEEIDAHLQDTVNPHFVTTAQIGAATKDELDAHLQDTVNPHFVTAAQIGAATKDELGQPNGICDLDDNGLIPAARLPAYVDNIDEFDTLDDFPAAGAKDVIYVDASSNKTYRWSGTDYVEIAKSPGTTDEVIEGVVNKYFTPDRVRDTLLAGLVTSINAALVEDDDMLAAFGKIQAHLTALDNGKAALASPSFTGAPTAQTAAAETNNTQLATTAFVKTALAGAVTYGTDDLTAGTSALATGAIYLRYEE